jgi:hypothetical protein
MKLDWITEWSHLNLHAHTPHRKTPALQQKREGGGSTKGQSSLKCQSTLGVSLLRCMGVGVRIRSEQRAARRAAAAKGTRTYENVRPATPSRNRIMFRLRLKMSTATLSVCRPSWNWMMRVTLSRREKLALPEGWGSSGYSAKL